MCDCDCMHLLFCLASVLLSNHKIENVKQQECYAFRWVFCCWFFFFVMLKGEKKACCYFIIAATFYM